jgi:hypothetical protein
MRLLENVLSLSTEDVDKEKAASLLRFSDPSRHLQSSI